MATLLSGGNPQIPKGDGDGPVQSYIAAMPGWKSEAGRRLDKLIAHNVPDVRKAVKWNSPFYGVDGLGFNGASLDPLPPEGSKDPKIRYLHIHENEAVDEKQLTSWIKQASGLPGWTAGM